MQSISIVFSCLDDPCVTPHALMLSLMWLLVPDALMLCSYPHLFIVKPSYCTNLRASFWDPLQNIPLLWDDGTKNVWWHRIVWVRVEHPASVMPGKLSFALNLFFPSKSFAIKPCKGKRRCIIKAFFSNVWYADQYHLHLYFFQLI